MKKFEFYLPSSDGVTTLYGVRFEPEEGPVRGVVQLAHGKAEHMGRYEEFAAFLTGEGFAVLGHDMLGHGRSVKEPEDRGFFGEKDGWKFLLRDLHQMTLYAERLYPEKPVFMVAHSMGSFLARRYVTLFPKELAGVILCGTGQRGYFEVHPKKRLARLIARLKGPRYVSPLLNKLYAGRRGPLESWICTRREVYEAYVADPLCGFPLTAAAVGDLLRLWEQLALEKDMDKIRRNLPVLLLGGMKDPVGGYSRGVLRVFNRLKARGLSDVDVFLYKDDAHELLQEEDRLTVMRDIERWITERL